MPNGDLWEHKPSSLGPALLLIVLAVLFLLCISPTIFSYALIAVIWLVIGAAVLIVGYVVFWLFRNRLSPITRVRSWVKHRRMKDWDVTVVGDNPETAAAKLGMLGRDPKGAADAFLRSAASPNVPSHQLAGGTDYYVKFSFNDKELELAVPERIYIIAEEGTEGLLVVKGEQFKEFFPMKRVEP